MRLNNPAGCNMLLNTQRRMRMSENEELRERIETIETHVARLEGVIHVLLEQLEAGTIAETAADIRAALPRIED